MSLERTGEAEYTETYGMYYEDFEVGVTIKHWPGQRDLGSRQYLADAAPDEQAPASFRRGIC